MKHKSLSIVIIVTTITFVIVATIGIIVAILKDKSKNKLNIDSMVFSIPISDENNETIINLEDEYRGKYKNIYDVDQNYTINNAIEDGCYVKVHKDVYNEDTYTDFMNNCNNRQNAFLRMILVTIEGDIIIEDYIYDGTYDVAYKYRDVTRDKFASDNQRDITYATFDNAYSNEEWKNIIEDIK